MQVKFMVVAAGLALAPAIPSVSFARDYPTRDYPNYPVMRDDRPAAYHNHKAHDGYLPPSAKREIGEINRRIEYLKRHGGSRREIAELRDRREFIYRNY